MQKGQWSVETTCRSWLRRPRQRWSWFTKRVTGSVQLRLYKGGIRIAGRTSPFSLYDGTLATFGEGGAYDQKDSKGFVRLFGLPLRGGVAPLPGGPGGEVENLIRQLTSAS
jgi:argininosuccinate synthase